MHAIINGTELHYDVAGPADAPWLVFSHSLACDRRMWAPQVSAFATRYRILTYDLRGHGRSAAPRGPYSLELLADDVLGLMQALRIDRCTFVGLSIGGMIGQTLALRHTQRFEKMVLADTGHGQSPETLKQWDERIQLARTRGLAALVPSTIERWFTPGFRESPPARLIAGLIAATPLDGYIGCVHAIQHLDTTARLGRIAVPLLAIAGDADPSAASTKFIADRVPGARFVSLRQAAHLSNVEQPEAFNRALGDFL